MHKPFSDGYGPMCSLMTNILIGIEYEVSCVLRLSDRSDLSSSDPVMVGPWSALLSLSPPSPYPLSLYAFSNCLRLISVCAGNTEEGRMILWGYWGKAVSQRFISVAYSFAYMFVGTCGCACSHTRHSCLLTFHPCSSHIVGALTPHLPVLS